MDSRTAPILAVVALSCSLIVPLDYTGGRPSGGSDGGVSSTGAAGGSIFEGGTNGEGGSDSGGAPEGGTGGSGDEGGSGGDGATGAMGGTGEAGGGGAGGTPSGGMSGAGAAGGVGGVGGVGGDLVSGGTGGDLVSGGTGGDTSGTSGDSGLGGSSAGVGGDGGRASGGIGGNPAGAAGGGMGGMSCGDVDSNPMQCGNCTTVCDVDDECIEGICVSSPCEGLCDPFTVVSHTPNDGYRVTNMASKAERCYEIPSYVPVQGNAALVCWNFGGDRILEVNGEVLPCLNGNGQKLTVSERHGGYCLHASAGDYMDAGFLFPDTTNF